MASHCSLAALPAIPRTIYEQIGGARCFAMLGAYNAVYGEREFIFMFRGSRKFNKIRITLTPMDVYAVDFYRLGKYADVTREKSIPAVYADQLREVIERETGLYTSL